MPILVVLESPAKVKKVGGFLGKDYIVKSSYGHIRDLDQKKLSINVDSDFEPIYSNNQDKENVIDDLKRIYKKCDGILLASDYDREGESIAWHIAEILKVPVNKRKRLLFTEITQKAILSAVDDQQDLDINMFYAQQARRIIDRLIGYKITPLLWKNIQSSMKKGVSLSAGRVQSVVNKLILEREEEINKFNSKNYYKTNAIFKYKKNNLNFELDDKIENKEKAGEFLEQCANYDFKITDVKNTTSKRSPSSPFITSSLQQEASNKFKFSPKKTMKVAQKLYENGHITYMRTDSVKLCDDIMEDIENKVKKDYGDKYYNKNDYKSKSKNSQEAHEAIRPSNIQLSDLALENDPNFESGDIKLYNLIWRRTVASQMSNAKIENQSVYAKIIVPEDNINCTFVCKNQKVLFDGFLRVYKPFNDVENDSDSDSEDTSGSNGKTDLSKITFKKGDDLEIDEVNCSEKFTKPPNGRFTEAGLVKKLEELGVGRPSTYSSMVSTVQDRNYVVKQDIEGVDKPYTQLFLRDYEIVEKTEKIRMNSEKQKLVPTEIGKIVNNFLDLHFETIINYNFTSNLEKELDNVASGTKDWVSVVRTIYECFNPIILSITESDTLMKDKYQRVIGIDPKTKFEIVTYIGKYGPLVQLKNTTNLNNSKFAPLGELKMEEVTVNQAMELLKYPYKFCDINKKDVIVCKGKFGIYLKYAGKNISLGKDESKIEETDLTRKIIKDLIENGSNTKSEYKSKDVKISDNIIIKNGKFGYYISYDKQNLALKYSKQFKSFDKKPEELNKDECDKIFKEYTDYKSKKSK